MMIGNNGSDDNQEEKKPEKVHVALEVHEIQVGPVKIKGLLRGRLSLAGLFLFGVVVGFLSTVCAINRFEQLSFLINPAVDKAMSAKVRAQPSPTPRPVVIIRDLLRRDQIFPEGLKYTLSSGQEVEIEIKSGATQARWWVDPSDFGQIARFPNTNTMVSFVAPTVVERDKTGYVKFCELDASVTHMQCLGGVIEILIHTVPSAK